MGSAALALALFAASCSSGPSPLSVCGPASIASTALDVASATDSEAGFSIAGGSQSFTVPCQ
jgi:hypothetical protein